jgi:hypothetical protein
MSNWFFDKGENVIQWGKKEESSFFFLFEIGSCYEAQIDLEFMILLTPPPNYWDYKHVPPYVARIVFSTNSVGTNGHLYEKKPFDIYMAAYKN